MSKLPNGIETFGLYKWKREEGPTGTDNLWEISIHGITFDLMFTVLEWHKVEGEFVWMKVLTSKGDVMVMSDYKEWFEYALEEVK